MPSNESIKDKEANILGCKFKLIYSTGLAEIQPIYDVIKLETLTITWALCYYKYFTLKTPEIRSVEIGNHIQKTINRVG